MVISMKKVTILLLASEKEDFLRRAQKTGMFEIIKEQEKIDKATEEKIELFYKVRRTVEALKLEKKKHKNFVPKIDYPVSSGFPNTDGSQPSGNLPDVFLNEEGRDESLSLKETTLDPLLILSELDRLQEELISNNREIERLEIDKKKLLPWGSFNMEAVKKLSLYGVHAHFYIMPIKKFKTVDTANLMCEIVHRDKKTIYFVIFSRDSSGLKTEEVYLPLDSLTSIIANIHEKMKIRTELENRILNYTGYIDALHSFSIRLGNSIQFNQARLHCNDDQPGKLTQTQAWFIADNEPSVIEFLKSFTLWYSIADPQADEAPPVKLKNNFLVKPFEVITRIFSLPSYFEMDPTPLFAPFFTLFFGLCIADVGYALIILLVLSVGYFKVSESMKPLFKLGIILGTFTLIAGYWLNTFFGFSIYQTPGMEDALIHQGNPGVFLSSYKEAGKMVFPAMSFALIIGFAQVLFGMVLQIMTRWKKSGLIFAVMPFSYILQIAGLMILSAHNNIMGFGSMKIGAVLIGESIAALPVVWSYYLLAGGTILLLFFNNPDKKIWYRPPLALWEFYGFASGIVGDILSYLRLFALGLAGGLLGAAFNNIAFMVLKPSPDSVINIFFAGMIFLFGHSLNIILSLLGAFVHSLRLTFVEFYKNLQFQGGGKPFTPLTLEK